MRFEEEFKKSRFITTLGPVTCAEEAKTFVAEIRSTFPDASHNCWAFLVGAPGTTTTVGMNDDGEPHNTAGRPMLNVLVHSGLGDIVAVVTRYWGGTNLGKGGLVRAYSSGVQNALAYCEVREKVDWATLEVSFDYTYVTGFKRVFPDFEATIESEDFGKKALFKLRLPADEMAGMRDALTQLTNGSVLFLCIETPCNDQKFA